MPNLSSRSLLELIALFERSSCAVASGDGQWLHGLPAWDLVGRVSLLDREFDAWTERIGFASSYAAPWGDGHLPVDLDEDDDPGRYRYRCPTSFRTKYVRADLVGVHAVRTEKLLNQIADLLAIPQSHRQGIANPAIEGKLWRLGKMRVGHVPIDVWLVRGLAASIVEVFRYFRGASLPDQGLIFTTGQALPEIVLPPRGYRIIPVAQILVDHAIRPHIDADLIHRLLLASAGSPVERSLPVRFDPYTDTLVIATKSDKPWRIKGGRQVAVVKYLFEQFVGGRRWVPAGEILDVVYGSHEGGRSRRIQSIFSGNTIWQDYITSDGHGKYGFNLD